MKKVIVGSVGALLVLLLATSGYPAQGTAAVQASGDITLRFGIQHEIDFEVRDNYDLDNGLTDGCTRATVTGNDCSGASARVDGFVQQETRFIIEGFQGDIWKARIVMEADDIWEPEQLATNQLERAWADVKLFDTPVHVRAGKLASVAFDPFRMVFAGDEDGVRVYATQGNISWSVWWIKNEETSDDSGTTGGRDGDQDYYLARVKLDFGAFVVSPAVGFLRNRQTTIDSRFATGLASVDAFGSVCHNFRTAGATNAGCGPSNTSNGVTVDESVVYPGLIAKGNFGPVSFVGQVFGAFGEIGDDSAVDAQRNQDVSALFVATDVGVKLGAWTPHVGILYLSGDDNPHDDDAEAWAAITSDADSFSFGTRALFVDDRLSVIGINNNSLDSTANNAVARQYFTQPGIIALAAGLKGRPTKKISTDLNIIYFQWDRHKQWEYVNGIVSTTPCTPTQTSSQQGVCSNSDFTNGVADGTGLVSTVDDEVGWELNGAVTYEYNKHVTLTISAAVFWPGDGAEVVAQCANNAGGGFLLGQGAQNGCVDPGGSINGQDIVTVAGIGRADDEAFNIETELKVQF